ncbi:serine O-acetyltransferase EpsC [Parasphaerochaeta coccoides]|uniref:serine O-acetyltransferase n=1 Tax=Parasphaerochaeta coccoides (strain ATCC BAA-1237 / DSM 17374 / SPN1) TaxID=760011 RepID=F4GJG6_PARC1|nr:serine O-acetyltransferase EpsC [Parasphaerochaeta coccoides]AEC02231.1 Serine O-acetyltransferase [Parasphaerochaeta coccoides DSM 17374]
MDTDISQTDDSSASRIVTPDVAARFMDTFHRLHDDDLRVQFLSGAHELPSSEAIDDIICTLLESFFPGRCGGTMSPRSFEEQVTDSLEHLATVLSLQIATALAYGDGSGNRALHEKRAHDIVLKLFDKLPEIRRMLKLDAQAGYEGDPAARTIAEVLISYPYLKCLAVHRVAHELYDMNVPLIPRMLSEKMHGETGIDIHPGARIGTSFFIDHGTGVVIGETSVIGNHVKLYQGVTLGALSFPKREDGGLIKGIKRHPNVGDNVTIYAHATILGNITIGNNVIIGSNSWIKEDVPPFTRVSIEMPKTILKTGQPKKKQS